MERRTLLPAVRARYALGFLALFLIEVCIALWGTGAVRGFLGDVLVVALIFCFLQAIFLLPRWPCALGVFLFACLIEGLQAVDYVAWLGLAHVPWASVVLGRSFSWLDIGAYALGAVGIGLISTNPPGHGR